MHSSDARRSFPHCLQSCGSSVHSNTFPPTWLFRPYLNTQRDKEATRLTLLLEAMSSRQRWPGRWVRVREEMKGNNFYLTHKGPTSPSSLSKAPGALSWRFVLVHSPTQLMENWAKYLTSIWSMFSCNTLFKIGQIDSGSGSKSTKKSLPFYHLIRVVFTTRIDLWTAQWQESFRTLFKLEGWGEGWLLNICEVENPYIT